MKNFKIVSVGGGMNAINHMIDSGTAGAEFISCSTREYYLTEAQARKKIRLGNLIYGLDSGSTPSRSEQAAIETREEILSALHGADAVIIVAGLGGCDGTGASPIVAQYAKELGALTVAVVSFPYKFEGPRRTARAEAALKKLSAQADAVIKIRSDKILEVVDKKTPLSKAFVCLDEIMCRAVKSLLNIFQNPFRIDDVTKINFSISTPDV